MYMLPRTRKPKGLVLFTGSCSTLDNTHKTSMTPTRVLDTKILKHKCLLNQQDRIENSKGFTAQWHTYLSVDTKSDETKEVWSTFSVLSLPRKSSTCFAASLGFSTWGMWPHCPTCLKIAQGSSCCNRCIERHNTFRTVCIWYRTCIYLAGKTTYNILELSGKLTYASLLLIIPSSSPHKTRHFCFTCQETWGHLHYYHPFAQPISFFFMPNSDSERL
jgi:hypothetical protein